MIANYYEHSRLRAGVQWWSDVLQPLGQGYRSSRLKRGIDWLEYVIRQSWLVRWMTTEPDPDVIVIDLRESWTVGPLVTLLVWAIARGTRAWRSSRTRRAVERATTAFTNAPVQITSAFFLVLALAQFAGSWPTASRGSLALFCFLLAPTVLGLRVDWTWGELVESKIGQLATAVLLPPEPPDDETR